MSSASVRSPIVGFSLALSLAAGGGLFAAGAALAQAPVDGQASAAMAQPQAAAAQTDTIDQQIAAWTQDPARAQGGGPAGDPNAASAPRQIHGEAGLAFGNHGYREGYVTADIPIGKASDLGVGVADSQIKLRNGRTVDNKSLFLSLSIGAGNGPGGPTDCRSLPMRTDGRYLEPMWESRMHGEALARDQAGCAGPVDYAAPPLRAAE